MNYSYSNLTDPPGWKEKSYGSIEMPEAVKITKGNTIIADPIRGFEFSKVLPKASM